MNAWTRVKVTNTKLQRDGQVGHVQQTTTEKEKEAVVSFGDGQPESFKKTDLTILAD